MHCCCAAAATVHAWALQLASHMHCFWAAAAIKDGGHLGGSVEHVCSAASCKHLLYLQLLQMLGIPSLSLKQAVWSPFLMHCCCRGKLLVHLSSCFRHAAGSAELGHGC